MPPSWFQRWREKEGHKPKNMSGLGKLEKTKEMNLLESLRKECSLEDVMILVQLEVHVRLLIYSNVK